MESSNSICTNAISLFKPLPFPMYSSFATLSSISRRVRSADLMPAILKFDLISTFASSSTLMSWMSMKLVISRAETTFKLLMILLHGEVGEASDGERKLQKMKINIKYSSFFIVNVRVDFIKSKYRDETVIKSAFCERPEITSQCLIQAITTYEI